MLRKVVVIETEKVVPVRRSEEKPCLYVGVRSVGESDGTLPSAVPDWVRDHSPRRRPDLWPGTAFRRKSNARARRDKLIQRLASQGYTVNLATTGYRLDVIELCPDPDKDGEKKAVYVGETGKTSQRRFEEHMAGGPKASPHVAKRGMRLRPDLGHRQKYNTREASQPAEARLAERLRERGFSVYGGH